MLNPKTGTVWTPDIRPDKIETFEETYTSEGGEQQAVTYKIVDNHPILNKVLDKFAFFKTHVSAIWYNKLANITLKQKLDEMDAVIQDVSVKTGFSIIRKAETSNLTVGANGITLKKPSIDGYIVIGLVGARVDTAQNILVKGFDGASGYVAIQNNSNADSHTISGSWLIQKM